MNIECDGWNWARLDMERRLVYNFGPSEVCSGCSSIVHYENQCESIAKVVPEMDQFH